MRGRRRGTSEAPHREEGLVAPARRLALPAEDNRRDGKAHHCRVARDRPQSEATEMMSVLRCIHGREKGKTCTWCPEGVPVVYSSEVRLWEQARLEQTETSPIPLDAEGFASWIADLLSSPDLTNADKLTAAIRWRDARLTKTPATRSPVCATWCSTYDWPEFNINLDDDSVPPLVYFTPEAIRAAICPGYCTPECRDAGRSLHPKGSK